MRIFIAFLVIGLLLALWEHDELMMVWVLKRRGGKFDTNEPALWGFSNTGFGVTFGDNSEVLVLWNKGHWDYYLMLGEDESSIASQAVQEIRKKSWLSQKILKQS